MYHLAFEEKKEFKINVLEANKLLDQAWISVSEKYIQNCFAEVKFASTSQENQETASELKNNTVAIWGRLQTVVYAWVTRAFKGRQVHKVFVFAISMTFFLNQNF